MPLLFLFGAICLVVGVIAFQAWILMLLWNWVVVAMFGAPPMTYWIGVGFSLLLALIGSFFKSASSGGK